MSNTKAQQKIKKVSAADFARTINEKYTPTETITWHGLDITIKHTLSLGEMIEFVRSVVQMVAGDDEYLPEVKGCAFTYCLLTTYANITLPERAARAYGLIYRSLNDPEDNIVDIVLSHINAAQYKEICRAVDERLAYITQARVGAITQQVNRLCAMMENLQEQYSTVFDGLTSGDMQQFVKALADGKLDENKMLNAYLDRAKSAKEQGEGTKATGKIVPLPHKEE